jgi:methionyl-tRNA synthetase
MSVNNFDGAVPEPGELTKAYQSILDLGPSTLYRVADHIEKIELRAGLRSALDAAAEVNAYLNATEPWRVLKEDTVRGGTILWTAIQAISSIRVALTPYLPFSSREIGILLGLDLQVGQWEVPPVPGGTKLGEIKPLFDKLESDALD